jgi:hypothetical protein
LVFSSIQKMEEEYFFEASVDFQLISRRYISEDRSLYTKVVRERLKYEVLHRISVPPDSERLN